MDKPLVSVIVPIYKVAPYLEKCIQSICCQTYDNLEIILVDDGSPDECPRICDQWAQKDDRIKVIHKLNGGPSEARNSGLNTARGKYIYFVDGDDYIESNLIELALPYMEVDWDMVIFGHYENWMDGTETIRKREQREFRFESLEDRSCFISEELLAYRLGWEPWNRVFRRDIIEKFGIRFEDHKKIFSEDLYFCLCYCAHIRNSISLGDCLYHYVQRPESTMWTKGKQILLNEMNELSKSVLDHYKLFPDTTGLIAYLPAFHYILINNTIVHSIRCKSSTIQELRKYSLQRIEDQSFFWDNLKAFRKSFVDYIFEIRSEQNAAECLSICQYLLDGSYTKLRLRNRCIYLVPYGYKLLRYFY